MCAVLVLWAVGIGVLAFATSRLAVDSVVYDFGEVTEGYVVEHAFVLTNVGDAVLHFTRAPIPDCGCTSAPLAVGELAPGQSIELVVTFNTTGYGGKRVGKHVDLFTDAPGARRVRLTVRGYVREAAPYEGSASSLYWRWYLLLDLRPEDDFRKGHLLGAVNIPLAELPRAMSQLPRGSPVYLYDLDGSSLEQALGALTEAGFVAVRGIAGGLAGWRAGLGDLFIWGKAPRGVPPAVSEFPYAVPPESLAREYIVVLDFRSKELYAAGHLPGALHADFGALAELAATLPQPEGDARLYLWCVDEDGTAACEAARFLRGHGFPDARCMIGGLSQWRLLYEDQLLWASDD
jgi:rhodanese-related sulfurtransferase